MRLRTSLFGNSLSISTVRPNGQNSQFVLRYSTATVGKTVNVKVCLAPPIQLFFEILVLFSTSVFFFYFQKEKDFIKMSLYPKVKVSVKCCT